jgi:hypothetical protein
MFIGGLGGASGSTFHFKTFARNREKRSDSFAEVYDEHIQRNLV